MNITLFNATLAILALFFFAAALAGGNIEIGGSKVGLLKSPIVRTAFFLLGIAALVLAFLPGPDESPDPPPLPAAPPAPP